jgi:hypothetical protein
MTGCTAPPFGDHDYSEPPHNTPDDPVLYGGDDRCGAALRTGIAACDGSQQYDVVVFQAGTHEWVRLFACGPCTATLRDRHRDLGPDGGQGIARVTSMRPGGARCS